MDDLGTNGESAQAPFTTHHDMLDQMHRQAMAKYNAIAKADTLAQEIRQEMDSLVDKGDAISDDDVLDAMARLVGKGADPQQLGSLMAGGQGPNGSSSPPMPQGGPGLAAWIQQMDQQLAAKEEALRGPLGSARLAALTSAVHVLVNHHVNGANPNGRSRSGRGPKSRSASSNLSLPFG